MYGVADPLHWLHYTHWLKHKQTTQQPIGFNLASPHLELLIPKLSNTPTSFKFKEGGVTQLGKEHPYQTHRDIGCNRSQGC